MYKIVIVIWKIYNYIIMILAKNLERLGTESAFSILAEAKKGYADRQKMLKKINNREFRYADSTAFDGLT